MLCQGHVVGTGGTGYFINNIVEPNVYFEKAESLLSECKTLDDLMTTLNRLQYDVALFGQEHLYNYEVVIDTAWGQAKQVLDITGELSVVYDANTWNVINSFANTITSNTGSPGVGSTPYGGGGGSGGGQG